MMKIIHIASGDLWAGAEVQLATLASELVKEHDVYAIILNQGRLSQELSNLGVKVNVLPESELSFVELIKQTRELCKQIAPDIIHSHRQKENILGGLAMLGRKSCRGVRTVHGSPEFELSWKQKLQRWLDNAVGKFIQDAIISVSDTLTDELIKVFSPNRVFTITNGIDPVVVKRDSLPPVLSLTKDHYHIGIAGRMSGVKRIDLFLSAAQVLINANTTAQPCEFHVFGDGPLFNDLQSMAKALNIGERVNFYGHRNDMRKCIAQMSLMVMTSDHEGLPMTALESLALGVPLVAHAVGGLEPLLKEGYKAGLVFEHEAKAYAKAIEECLNTRSDSVTLPPHYTAQENAKQVTELYQQLLR